MKRFYLITAFVLALLLTVGAMAQQTQQAPTPQAPASQGNQPSKPGAAQKTAHEPVAPGAQQVKPWARIPIPPLPAFHPATPKRVELPNGMVVFLQENHELPLISASARIRGGSHLEPAAKVGLVDIYGEVWRTGGTKAKTGDQMDDYLEARAAKIETDGGGDSTTISLNCLKADFDDVFALFEELLHDPAFRDEKIALAKDQMKTMIARRNDDIGGIAAREAAFLAYGKNSPYARIPEYATVAAVTREDLVKWHDQYVHPNNILLGVIGDFDSAQMEAKLRKAFESWPKGPEAPKPEIKVDPAAPGYYYVAKEDVNQSAIRMVGPGIRRDNPDYAAVSVMNEVFGGGMSSRLFKTIRTKQGLAYNVGGGVGAAFDHPGVSRISMGTKSASTAEAIKSLDQQIVELLKEPATPEEMKIAKDGILNSFIFTVDTPEKVLGERLTYAFYGYPLDFLERYRAAVEKVTADDVARVAHKYVKPGMFAVLVVGNDEASKEIAALGPVKTLDIAIPNGAATEAAATPKPAASNPQGKALIAKVIDAMGGRAKVESVKSMKETTSSTIKSPQGEMQIQGEGTVVFPDKMHTTLNTPMGPMNMVVTSTAAFMAMSGQVRDIPASQRGEMQNSIKRDLLFIAQHANDPKFTFTANGTEKIGNAEAQVLDINADGAAVRWYVDPQTGHVLRESYSGMSQAGPAQITVDYSDWKAVDGISLPTQKVSSQNGQQVSTEQIQQFQINPPVDPKLFEKPTTAPAAPGN